VVKQQVATLPKKNVRLFWGRGIVFLVSFGRCFPLENGMLGRMMIPDISGGALWYI